MLGLGKLLTMMSQGLLSIFPIAITITISVPLPPSCSYSPFPLPCHFLFPFPYPCPFLLPFPWPYKFLFPFPWPCTFLFSFPYPHPFLFSPPFLYPNPLFSSTFPYPYAFLFPFPEFITTFVFSLLFRPFCVWGSSHSAERTRISQKRLPIIASCHALLYWNLFVLALSNF